MNQFRSIIGHSPALDSLIRVARIAAATDVTILLKGETGTGKEVFAQTIQKTSPRAHKTFITLNCAALPESLVESELFGHKKGAFTGAHQTGVGLFKAADGGTLFLDEINSLPLSMQGRLLRFLDSGECLAVGDTKPYHVDVRIIAATNVDLGTLIEAGKFRRDLYFRLNVVPIELPTLAERAGDIESLANHFFALFAADHALDPPRFGKQALKALKAYVWPGNVRELRNLCERLCILLAGKTIEVENLPPEYRPGAMQPEAARSGMADGIFVLPERGIELESVEASLINQALRRTNGNRSKSARLLGLSRDTLLYRMQKHGLT